MFVPAALASLLATMVLHAGPVIETGPAGSSAAKTVASVFQAVPPQWHRPIGLFLNSSISVVSLQRKLLSLAPPNLPQMSPAHRIDALRAMRSPQAATTVEVQALAGDFLQKAAAPTIQKDESDVARKYVELNLVLGAFLPESDLATLARAAEDAHAGLPPTDQARLEALLRRTAEELIRSLPAGLHIGGFSRPVSAYGGEGRKDRPPEGRMRPTSKSQTPRLTAFDVPVPGWRKELMPEDESPGLVYYLDRASGRIYRMLDYARGKEEAIILHRLAPKALGDKDQTSLAEYSGRVPVVVDVGKGAWRLHPVPDDVLAKAADALAREKGVSFAQAFRIISDANQQATGDKLDTLRQEAEWIRQAWGQVKLDESGAIALDDLGFPDEDSYVVVQRAVRLLHQDTRGMVIRDTDKALLQSLRAVYKKTDAVLFSGDNALARTVSFAEKVPVGKDMPILDYIRTERFTTGLWWIASTTQYDSDPAIAWITAKTSQSPFVRELGNDARSTIFWSSKPHKEDYIFPDPLGMRVRVNYDRTGNERTMEVIAPLGRNLLGPGRRRWQGFFFKKIGDEWVIGDVQKTKKQAMKCMQCHYSVDILGRRHLAPLPAFLKTETHFRAVGYNDAGLIKRYLKIFR